MENRDIKLKEIKMPYELEGIKVGVYDNMDEKLEF